MYLMSLGYPLYVKEEGVVVELDNTHCVISPDDALTWVEYIGIYEVKKCNDTLNRLIYMGVLCSGKTFEELYRKISTNRVVRQGCGSANDGKHALYLGDKIFYPTQIQHDIWKLANSKRALSEIMMMLKSKYNNSLGYKELFENMQTLIKESLIFVV